MINLPFFLRFVPCVGLGLVLLGPMKVEALDSKSAEGFELAKKHCARCHVIGDFNRLGGIGNTPSFPYMVQNVDWHERFSSFFSRRPHPVFVRVEGYKKWSDSDPYYPPFELTLIEIQRIVAYAESLASKSQ